MIRLYITAIITAMLVSAASYGLHCISQARLANKHRAEIAALSAAKDAACMTAKAITNEVSNAYQKELTALDVAADDAGNLLDLLRGNGASAIQPGVAASGRDAGAAGKKLYFGDSGILGPDPQKLIAIGKRAEKTRLQLLACQQFVRKTQKPLK